MTYSEFKTAYKWSLKKWPDTADIFRDDMQEKIGALVIQSETKSGSKWIETKRTEKQFSRENYFNAVDAIPFFRNLGGTETVTCNYTKFGYIPVKVISTNPDKTERRIYKYSFD